MKLQGWRAAGAAFLAGALAALAMPPLYWLPLAVVGMVVFVWLWETAKRELGPDAYSALWLHYREELPLKDVAGVLAQVTGLIAGAGISIDAMLQREADEVSGEGGTQTDLIILTHACQESRMDKALALMQALPTVLAPIVRIRKEELA